MSDTPLWTATLSPTDSRMVLRALLAAVPGLGDGPLKEWFRGVIADLQRGLPSIEGCNVDLIALQEIVSKHYQTELAEVQSKEAFDRSVIADKWAATILDLIKTKPTKVRKAPPKPVKLVAQSLFGDEG